jgi:hypothetical protein
MWKLRACQWLCWLMLAVAYAALLSWAGLVPLLWIVRDGLGPDAQETAGWDAIWQFMPVPCIGQCIVIFIALTHLGELWLRRRIAHRAIQDESSGQ